MKIKPILISVNCLLLGLLAFLCVDIFYQRISTDIDERRQHSHDRGAHVVSKDRQANRPFSHYSGLIQRDLFGKAPHVPQEQVPLQAETLEPTERKLRLWGTVTGALERAYAIIEDRKKRGRGLSHDIYHVGDRVQGAEIDEILREKVILVAEGNREVLEMERYGGRLRPKRKSGTPVRQRKVVRRSTIENAMVNLDTLITQARITTHPKGLVISRIKRNSLFQKLGLKNGDVIRRVAGKRIRSINDAMTLYRRLGTISKVSVEFLRRGRERMISYIIR